MIELLTAGTPNGWKASVALEEMELPYTVTAIDLGKMVQKEEWFLRLNPNGRIPVIVDHGNDEIHPRGAEPPGRHAGAAPLDLARTDRTLHRDQLDEPGTQQFPTRRGGLGEVRSPEGQDRPGFVVFESGAILLYLAEKTGKFLPTDPKARSVAIQWLMFQMGGIGPMMGQANVFVKYAPERLPWAIDRYQRECRRLFEVLERRLSDVDYLAGEYSIADIANWCWVQGYSRAELSIDGLPKLQAWLDRIAARPAVQRGKQVPPTVRTTEESIAVARTILV